MLEDFRREQEKRDEKNWEKIEAMVKETRIDNNSLLSSQSNSITQLKNEIYGMDDKKGIRGRMGDLEGKLNWFAGIQMVLTLMGSSIAAYLGMRIKS